MSSAENWGADADCWAGDKFVKTWGQGGVLGYYPILKHINQLLKVIDGA
jgi:hypothetical protein